MIPSLVLELQLVSYNTSARTNVPDVSTLLDLIYI